MKWNAVCMISTLMTVFFSCKNVDNTERSARYFDSSGKEISEIDYTAQRGIIPEYHDSNGRVITKKEYNKIYHIAPVADNGKWVYSSEADKMSNADVYFASIDAENKLHFSYPYEESGGTTARLTIRKRRGDLDILLSISSGQFIAGVTGRVLNAKFDDSHPQKYPYVEPSDFDSKTVFINGESAFYSKIKKANKLLIEIEFYNEGSQVLEFDIRHFKERLFLPNN